MHPYGYESAPARKANAAKWIEIDFGRTVPVDVMRLFPESSRSHRGKQADGNTKREIRLLTSAATDHAGQEPLFETLTNISWRGAEPLEINCHAMPARHIRIIASRLTGSKGDYRLRLGEVQVISEGRNVALGANVSA